MIKNVRSSYNSGANSAAHVTVRALMVLMVFVLATQSDAADLQNSCSANSPEMALYQRQQSWQPYSIKDETDVAPIPGFLDQDGAFYFSDFSRGGKFVPVVEIDPSNKRASEFAKYCSLSSLENRPMMLRVFRMEKSNGRYGLTVHFMPSMSGLKNQPMKDQNTVFGRTELNMKYDPNSFVEKGGELNLQKFKDDVYLNLLKQIDAQKATGTVHLDFTGLDDVFCDVLLGRLQISFNLYATSSAALVTAKKLVEPSDVNQVFAALKSELKTVTSKEEALFTAGRITSMLEQSGRVAQKSHRGSFAIVKKLMTADLSRMADLDSTQLSCAVDQLQSYQRDPVISSVGVTITTPNYPDPSAGRVTK